MKKSCSQRTEVNQFTSIKPSLYPTTLKEERAGKQEVGRERRHATSLGTEDLP